MMTKKWMPCFLIIAAAVFAFCGCRQRDIRVTKVRVPNVYNQECQTIVVSALAKIDGIELDKITFADGVMTVTYDSLKLGIKNIEHAVKDAGFDANDFEADKAARAKLPPACLTPAAK